MLAAIYNVFDGEELLEGSIRQIRPHVDLVILIGQHTSNFGNFYGEGLKECQRLVDIGLADKLAIYNPGYLRGSQSEGKKRDEGRKIADRMGAMAFIHMDCDEYFDGYEFEKAYNYWIASGSEGSICRIATYFKSPEWRLTPDESYFMPAFHRIKPQQVTGTQNYKNASMLDGTNMDRPETDPTRVTFNTKTLVEVPMTMHHYSWLRRDIDLKLRNSSSRDNLGDIDKLVRDVMAFEFGAEIPFFGKKGYKLSVVPNKFGIDVERFSISNHLHPNRASKDPEQSSGTGFPEAENSQ